MNAIIELPLQIQAILVSGYLGYILINRDHRSTEKNLDVWLMILLLGLPTAITLKFCSSEWGYLSILIAPVIAFLWAKWGKYHWFRLLRSSNVSYETGDGDAWKTLTTRKNVAVTQITVTLKNGNKYHCENAHQFSHNSFAPYVKDDDGIAFYVTHYCTKTKDGWGNWQKAINVCNSEWGDEITYFPRADIAMLEMRCLTK